MQLATSLFLDSIMQHAVSYGTNPCFSTARVCHDKSIIASWLLKPAFASDSQLSMQHSTQMSVLYQYFPKGYSLLKQAFYALTSCVLH